LQGEEMRGRRSGAQVIMRVLVIGGTGFIGTRLLRGLYAAGHEVTVYHRGVHEPPLPDGIRHVRSALAVNPLVAFPDELHALSFDVVVHMTLIGERDAEAVVEAFRDRAGRLVAASSGDVYAVHGQILGLEASLAVPAAALTEDAPLRSVPYPYGRRAPGPWGELVDYDKILVERIVLGEPALPATVLRLPAVYGPGDSQRRFLPWLKRMDDARPAILIGAAEARWRFTHGYVENVAAALAVAVSDGRAAGRVYNVGEAPTPTVAERVAMVGRAAGWGGTVVVLPDDGLPAHLRAPYRIVADLAYDTTRIRRELGYAEPVAAVEGLGQTVTWERALGLTPRDPTLFDYGAEDRALATAACSGEISGSTHT
jgi:nucleoside-diphosphate-sugar epimerase